MLDAYVAKAPLVVNWLVDGNHAPLDLGEHQNTQICVFIVSIVNRVSVVVCFFSSLNYKLLFVNTREGLSKHLPPVTSEMPFREHKIKMFVPPVRCRRDL